MKPVVIVGAGPAGISAARTLLDHGITPCLVDENLRGGGQIYRRQPQGFQRKQGRKPSAWAAAALG